MNIAKKWERETETKQQTLNYREYTDGDQGKVGGGWVK